MNSIILQIASKYVRWFMIILSVFVLIRGHNYPGGGFIGGLLAGLAMAYNEFAYIPANVQDKGKVNPEYVLVLGIVLILLSALPGLWTQGIIMHGEWITVPFPFTEGIKLGTPFLFDVGVFFIVIGITVLFLFSLTSPKSWKSQ